MGAFLDNVQFDTGGGVSWLDEWTGKTIAYQHGGADGWYVALFDVAALAMRRAVADPAAPFYGWGCNALYADGGVWAGWLAGVGLFTSYGLHLPAAGLLGVGPDGELAYKPDHQSNGPAMVRERDGSEWLLSDGVVYDLQLLGGGRALWTEGADVVRTRNLPAPLVLPGGVWAPRAVVLDGVWWLCYYSGSAGVVLHPFNAFDGYVIVPLGENAWHDAITLLPPSLARVVWSRTEGEGAGDIRWRDVNVALEPRVDLTPAPPIEPPEPPIEPPEPPIEPPVEPVEPPVNPPVIPEVKPMRVALSQPSYINWRWSGGQSLEPPTNPDDPNREPFEYGRPTAGVDEWAELVPCGDYVAVRSPNGRSWLSVQLDGSLEERDAAGEPGEWELFTLQDDGVLVEKAKEGVTRPPVELIP